MPNVNAANESHGMIQQQQQTQQQPRHQQPQPRDESGGKVTGQRMFVTTVQHIYTVSAWEYTAETNKASQNKYINLSHNLKIY